MHISNVKTRHPEAIGINDTAMPFKQSKAENENPSNAADRTPQQCTPAPKTKTATQPLRYSSSTPRRRKDPLANLYSNLSPKYIGSTSSMDSEGLRSLRSRKLHASAENLSKSAQLSPSTDVIGCVRRTPVSDSVERISSRKPFVSPIDKLLQKNGATAPNDSKIFLCSPNKKSHERKNLKTYQRHTRSSTMAHAAENQLQTKATNADPHEYIMLSNESHADSETADQCGYEVSTHEQATEAEENARETTNTPKRNESKEESLQTAFAEEHIEEEETNEKQKNLTKENLEAHIQQYTESAASEVITVNQSTDRVELDEVNGENDDSVNDIEQLTNNENQSDEKELEQEQMQHVSTENENNSVKNGVEMIIANSSNVPEYATEMKKEVAAETAKEASIAAEQITKISNVIAHSDENFECESETQQPETELNDNSRQQCELIIKMDHADTDASLIDANAIGASAQSPSAVSMDSAKGSSVVQDIAWMTFTTGDLFWGQIFSYCYWPCMVCPDPEGRTITTEENRSNGDQVLLVHVRFFADNGRRNWVKRENLLVYTGLESYKERIVEALEKYGKKSSKYKLLVPKQSKRHTWHEAICEANIIVEVSYAERLEKFYEIFEKSKALQKLERKRRQSMFMPTGSTSDIGSLCDSMENADNKQTNVPPKRQRSNSPLSVLQIPTKAVANKRRRLSRAKDPTTPVITVAKQNDEIEQQTAHNLRRSLGNTAKRTATATPTPTPTLLQENDLFSAKEFKQFHAILADFVVEQHQHVKLEKSLLVAVRNVWALKQINQKQLEYILAENNANASVTDVSCTEEAAFRRFANRIKTVAMRCTYTTRMLAHNQAQQQAHAIGDLYWGQIYSYSYWPCMVCPDPEGKIMKTEGLDVNSEPNVYLHVRFFADNGSRSWVKRQKLIAYKGHEHYRALVDDMLQQQDNRFIKRKHLLPKKDAEPLWQLAIKEADTITTTPYVQRLEKFVDIYEKSKIFQKTERNRRNSILVRIESVEVATVSNANDDITLELHNERRSVSPLSPAFSPIKSAKSNRSVNSFISSASTTTAVQEEDDAEQFNRSEFKKFYNIMKDFVMGLNVNEKLENSLAIATRNIWELKQIVLTEAQKFLMATFNEDDLGSSVVVTAQHDGTLKRLSNRIKGISIRRSLNQQTNSAQNSPQLLTVKEIATEEKPKLIRNRPIQEVIDDIFNLDRKYLFKGLSREPVCKYCLQPGGKLGRCANGCQAWLHSDCIQTTKRVGRRNKTATTRHSISENNNTNLVSSNHITADDSNSNDRTSPETQSAAQRIEATPEPMPDLAVVCRECALYPATRCSVCDKSADTTSANEEPIIFCNMPQCTKAFHPTCCRYWPQAKIVKSKNNIESFRCPSHVCHTCVSDDPKGKFQHLSNSKLTKCIKCPATYHMNSTCIPAGSQILTASCIVCPRHSNAKAADVHINVSWCFICVSGGQVVCCETCPTAVHAACLNIPIDPHEGYICEECESGRMPLYGEMVWAKFNTFRWWPAIILPPTEVPENIKRKPHNANDFVVRFFGTHDHGWISRRRVYLYLEGDCEEPPKSKSHLDQLYNRGVEEARSIYEIIKLKKQAQQLDGDSKEKLHPQPYVRIKANRAVPPVKLHIDMEKVNKCECSADAENACGPDSNCLNRVLYHECNPKLCPAGERCQNQMFETRISPRLDVAYMRERGFGLVCREPITAGTFIIEYVGEVINDDEFQQRMSQKSVDREENFYFLSVEKGYIIDAGPKGNLARFMNHSCDPNCETQKWSVNGLNRVGLFAIKDIPANTELTFNYHWDELLGNEKKTCFCGAAKCAGQIGEKYKEEKPKEDIDTQTKSKTGAAKRVSKSLKRLKKKSSKVATTTTTKQRIEIKIKLSSTTTATKRKQPSDVANAVIPAVALEQSATTATDAINNNDDNSRSSIIANSTTT